MQSSLEQKLFFLALQQHGHNHDGALEGLAQEGRNAHQIEQVVHHGDNQHAQHRAADGALAALHAGAAHDHGGDCVHLIAAAGVGIVHGADARHLDHRRNGHQRAHQDVNPGFYPLHMDAR